MILTALDRDWALNPDDPSMLSMHTLMSLVGMFICGAAVFQAQGKISKLYAYPLTTSQLVAWRLLPAMAILILQMVAITAVLNAAFDLDWPIWGPALASAIMFAAVEATLWLTENSVGWLLLAMTIVSGLLGMWFKSRYGGVVGQPIHYWRYVSPTDVITMLAVALASYWVAVKGVARNRCGEPPFSLGMLDWINRILESYTTFRSTPASALAAQFRFEWQRKGWLMPAGVAVIVVGGLIFWFFDSRDPDDLFLAFLGGGGALWMFGFIGGIVFGNIGRNDADFSMGSFVATRPIADGDLARTILKAAAVSVLLMWLIWAFSFAILCLPLLARGSIHFAKLDEVSWLLYPATLLGPWAVTATGASLLLSGRAKLIVVTLFTLIGAFLAGALISTLLSNELQSLLRQSATALVTSAILIGTAVLFFAAWRNRLIGRLTIFGAAAFWLIGSLSFVLEKMRIQQLGWLEFLLLAAALALVVLPFAAAPLAIASNRHR
jgi:hypothetical protein